MEQVTTKGSWAKVGIYSAGICALAGMFYAGHSGLVWSVEFGPDGRALASGSGPVEGAVALCNALFWFSVGSLVWSLIRKKGMKPALVNVLIAVGMNFIVGVWWAHEAGLWSIRPLSPITIE